MEPGTALVDEVDSCDTVMRTVTRAEMRAGNLRHRGVAIIVLDSQDRLLVHRRSELKDVWPGRWDLAAGGVVEHGEDYVDAAQRELAEELGIVATEMAWLGIHAFEDDRVKVISAVFLVRHDGDVTFADGEVVESRWITSLELRALLSSSTWCPDSLSIGLPLLADHVPAWKGFSP